MANIDVRPEPAELVRTMSADVYRDAYRAGQNLSGYLELRYPQEEYKDGMDGFTRLCHIAGVRSHSNTQLGLWASTFDEAFGGNETNKRALYPEWAARQWRKVQMGAGERAIYSSTDLAQGDILRPYAEILQDRGAQQLRAAIPLSEVVALTTPIDTDAYHAYYVTDNAAEQRMVRVGEGAEIPRATLTTGETTIRLKKYGRALEFTYEQLRRMRIDRLALHIQRMAVQVEADKVTAAMDVLVNGDGNPNTAAAVHDLTTLDTGATAGTLSLKGWLAYKMKFYNPYMITTALATEASMLQLMLLDMGASNIPMATLNNIFGFGAIQQINSGLRDAVRIGWTADAPALKIVGFDARIALERVIEIGAGIQEIDSYITRQTQVMTMTEVEGWAVLDTGAAQILDINA